MQIHPSPRDITRVFGKDYLGKSIMDSIWEHSFYMQRLSKYHDTGSLSFPLLNAPYSLDLCCCTQSQAALSSHGRVSDAVKDHHIPLSPQRAPTCIHVQRAREHTGLCSLFTSTLHGVQVNNGARGATALHFNWVHSAPASLLLSATQCHPTHQGSTGARTPSFHFR